jgi:hypothetical protein
MRLATRPLVTLVAVGLLVLVATACGGGSKKSEPSAGDVTSFSQGPFSGDVDQDWLPVFLDIKDPNSGKLPDGMPDSIVSIVSKFFSTPASTNVFYVFFDKEKDFSANVNILPCEPSYTVQIVSNPDNIIKFYNENHIKAEKAGSISYNGGDYDLIKLDFTKGYDTYTVVLKTGDCYNTVTLNARQGQGDKLDDLKFLLSRLVIDPEKFPKS